MELALEFMKHVGFRVRLYLGGLGPISYPPHFCPLIWEIAAALWSGQSISEAVMNPRCDSTVSALFTM